MYIIQVIHSRILYRFMLWMSSFLLPVHHSTFVSTSEEELSFSLPGPHVQWRPGGEAAFPSEDPDRVSKEFLLDVLFNSVVMNN